MSTGVKDPAETDTALAGTLSLVIAFGTNKRAAEKYIAAEKFKEF